MILWILYFTGIVDITQWVGSSSSNDKIDSDMALSGWFIYDLVWSSQDNEVDDILNNDAKVIDVNNYDVLKSDAWKIQSSVRWYYTWSVISLPYVIPDDQWIESGKFIFLWTTENKKSLYVYKLKYGWNIGGVANKWISFSSWNIFLNTSLPHFIDSNGISIETWETLAVNQLVFIETDLITTKE